MKTRFLPAWLAFVFFFSFSFLWASEPDGYYRDAYGKGGFTLKTALHNIIKGHTTISYDGLYDAYKKTDVKDGRIWDMYSNCNFNFGATCGNYSKECDCYNREHSFPKSWFGGKVSPMYSDLFHLYPTDGYVNNRRGNNPFGEVSNPTYTSHNGSKVGKNTTSGFSGTVFEPVDEYKGDFARTYFYMATRYEDRIASWGSCPVCAGNNKASFKQWAIDLLLKWHRQDPVSQKERDRNDAVYGYQHNRNPFIDHPELVEKIWGNDNTVFDPADPNPPVNPDDPDNPDNPDNPDEPTYTTYEIWYEYHDAEGNMVEESDNMITIKVPHNQSKAEESGVIFDEHFSKMAGTEDNNSALAATVDLTDGYVQAFADGAYQGVHSVRLASGKKAGSIIFKEFDASGNFTVTVSGKGWSATEKEATLECDGCTAKSQPISFTKSKADLSSGVFETIQPVSFTANGKVKLTVSTVSGKRVYIDRVLVAGSGSNPDNPDNPDTTLVAGVYGLKILYPQTSDTVRKAAVSARVALVNKEGEQISKYTLGTVELPNTGNYSLWTNLWQDTAELDEQTMDFVYALPNSGDTVMPEPVETPVITPNGGEVAKGTEVTITCTTKAATIYYTTNGSKPTENDEQYAFPIVVNEPITLQAIAVKDGEMSDVAKAVFTIKEDHSGDTVGVETFNPVRFKVYPNPNSGRFTIEMLTNDNLVEIFSVKGSLVLRRKHVGNRFDAELSKAGVYFIRVTNEFGGDVRRIVVY